VSEPIATAGPLGAAAPGPPVTVVTVVRNARATIEATLESVRSQTHRPLDHLVLDGASTDGTLDVLRRAGGIRFESAPDDGIYDAMNRAIDRIDRRESYVFFLNADDRFVAPEAVARVMAHSWGADFVHCLLERRDDALRYRDVVGGAIALHDLVLRNRCGHQMIFARRSLFDRVGRFDLGFRIAADYDWVIRVFQRPELTKRFVPEVCASMGAGGVSDQRYLRLLAERRRIVRERFGKADEARFLAFAAAFELPGLAARRLLDGVGLLRAARVVRRALRGGPRAPAR